MTLLTAPAAESAPPPRRSGRIRKSSRSAANSSIPEKKRKVEPKVKSDKKEQLETVTKARSGAAKKGDGDSCFSLHPNIELKESSISGLGVFAVNDIKKGDVIWDDPDGNADGVYTLDELQTWPKDKLKVFLRWAYQISPTQLSGFADLKDALEDASSFQNHSCDPNTVFVSDIKMIACRDIKAGEEITYDYATSETYHWSGELRDGETMKCLCGSELCRGRVSPDDWKRPELRERYGNHWMPYILDLMQREKAQEKSDDDQCKDKDKACEKEKEEDVEMEKEEGRSVEKKEVEKREEEDEDNMEPARQEKEEKGNYPHNGKGKAKVKRKKAKRRH